MSMDIVNNTINDVHVAVVAGKQYVCVSTNGGATGAISLINETDEVVYDLGTANDDANSVWLTSDGTLYILNEAKAQLEVFYNVQDIAADDATPDITYDESSIPALWASAPTVNVAPCALRVIEGGSFIDGKSNKIFVCFNEGAIQLNEKQGDETNGSVKPYTTEFIGEDFIGDQRGYWALQETTLSGDPDADNKCVIGAKGDLQRKGTWADADLVTGVRGSANDLDGSTQYFKHKPEAEYADSNADTDIKLVGIAATADNTLGQGFKPTNSSDIGTVRLWLKRTGTFTNADLTVETQTDNAGVASGTPIANGTSDEVACTGIGTSLEWVGFKFSTNPTVVGGTQYHVVLKGNADYVTEYAVATEFVEWGVDQSSPSYANGVFQTGTDDAGWAAYSPASDGCFEVYNDEFDITGNLTVGAWVKTAASARILTKYDVGGLKVYSLGLSAAGYPFWEIYDAGGAQAATGTIDIRDSIWHFVVGVFDVGTSVTIFLDGIQNGQDTTGLSGNLLDISVPMIISGRFNNDALANLWAGSIASPFVTAETLTADQIKHMYEVGKRALENHTASRVDAITADNYQKLQGTSNIVKAVAVDEEAGMVFIGTNDGLDGGAVTALGLNDDTVHDQWKSGVGIVDDKGVPWNANDIVAISVASVQRVNQTNHGLIAIATDQEHLIENPLISMADAIGESVSPFIDKESVKTKRIVVGDKMIDSEGMVYRWRRNRTSDSLGNGDVIVYDLTDDDGKSIGTTTTANVVYVAGVVVQTIESQMSGWVQTKGLHSAVKLDGSVGNIAAGDAVGTYTTAKKGGKTTTANAAFGWSYDAVTTDTTAEVMITIEA